MNSQYHIDWLSITIPVGKDSGHRKLSDVKLWADLLAAFYTCDTSHWRVSKPMFGYTEAYQSSCGTIAMYGKEEMGLHIIYSGQALQRLALAGVSTERIIQNAHERKARCTRADIALDIRECSAGIPAYKNQLTYKRAITSATSWRCVENGAGGATLYIGSRSSERMVRIYDKKAERAAALETVSESSWIRCEVELKGDRAKDFMNAARDNNMLDVMSSHLIATIDFPHIPEFQQAAKQAKTLVEPTETKRKDTKTRQWLMKTVAPVIAKECVNDGAFYAELLSEINAQIQSLLGPKDKI